MANSLGTAPVLSTPDNHILAEVEGVGSPQTSSDLSEIQFKLRFEIDRTIAEIRKQRWQRVALQFPDHMLPSSARVFQMLSKSLNELVSDNRKTVSNDKGSANADLENEPSSEANEPSIKQWQTVKLTILADTSYGSCCVDEIAAEHVEADAVIHYGRTCLSPTARLPVLHVFTQNTMDLRAATDAFLASFANRDAKVILTADTPFASQVKPLAEALLSHGYNSIFMAEIVHDPSSIIPNRTVPDTVLADATSLREWGLYHIAEPPTALLLTLSSKVKNIYVFDPNVTKDSNSSTIDESNTSILLRRRYALVTSMNTVSTWGILINTLSVKNYLHIVDHVKKQIAAAGKKSYLFVVGKLNAAKVANFAEIGGWVVIGCWESSLIDSRDFFKPILTPFELELALMTDDSRVWTGTWRSDFAGILAHERSLGKSETRSGNEATEDDTRDLDSNSEEESEPPEFDLRTGKYISRTRPMKQRHPASPVETTASGTTSRALTKKMNGDIATVNGISSPAAEYLAQTRTWKGLGSDFTVQYEDEEVEGAHLEQGRSGVARGYRIGESSST